MSRIANSQLFIPKVQFTASGADPGGRSTEPEVPDSPHSPAQTAPRKPDESRSDRSGSDTGAKPMPEPFQLTREKYPELNAVAQIQLGERPKSDPNLKIPNSNRVGSPDSLDVIAARIKDKLEKVVLPQLDSLYLSFQRLCGYSTTQGITPGLLEEISANAGIPSSLRLTVLEAITMFQYEAADEIQILVGPEETRTIYRDAITTPIFKSECNILQNSLGKLSDALDYIEEEKEKFKKTEMLDNDIPPEAIDLLIQFCNKISSWLGCTYNRNRPCDFSIDVEEIFPYNENDFEDQLQRRQYMKSHEDKLLIDDRSLTTPSILLNALTVLQTNIVAWNEEGKNLNRFNSLS